jgi:fumarate hydratase, class II
MATRRERDPLGSLAVPADAYFGIQTQRAVQNFPVSGLRLPPVFLRAQARIKLAAAKANLAAGRLDPKVAAAIVRAAREVIAGRHDREFVVDVFQAGAGTSQNMNMNEVLANRAEELLGGKKGQYRRVHPNDQVNLAQSTNDTFHVAIHLAALEATGHDLLPSLRRMIRALRGKERAFAAIVKAGRTHLQDAVPLTLGQTFGAFASQLSDSERRLRFATDELLEICLGGTALGTGLNADPDYAERAVAALREETGLPLRLPADLFAAMQGMERVLGHSAALRELATVLCKVADDLRLLASGPRTGLNEIALPAVQPGSSIMPGKINPSILEMVNQVCYQVFGCDAAIHHAARSGQLELNVMMPVIAHNLLFAIQIMANAMAALERRCIAGIRANRTACRYYAERSPALATALSPAIGYQRAAALAKEALAKNKTVAELAMEMGLLSRDKLSKLLDLYQMTRPGKRPSRKSRG